ncbi:4-amino-4-deoxy-L-arabinose transferase and related glycosyltransferases of PMT family [alpha proteobacterium U9-1i]|nr:4-amino-4-deoxy-L-arabinose transferase and related glycosyltransferases of PMT family [alpha proteobacterium U9-1i]
MLIALIALISGLFGAARMPVMDRDEARFAQATRQMIETGDYVRIRNQEDERNKKPIGIHWLQVASVQAFEPLTGKLNAIWPYRLPSALGAMLAALACLWGGSALMRPREAFLGAALFSAGVLLGFEGMTAKTDAVLVGFTTLAMAALARLYAGSSRPRAIALLFWLAMGCGVLIKGPVTPMVAGLTLIGLAAWERRWDWMKPLAWWPGPLLAAAIVAPWMIAINEATQGRFFAEAIGEDLAPKMSGGAEGHFALPGYHLALFVFLFFPASYALPMGVRLGWRTLRAKANDAAFAGLRFLLAWALPTFLVFELLPTKLAHYTLPTFPALALLCGAGLFAASRERWRITHIIGVVLFVLTGAAIAGLCAAGATFMPGDADAAVRRAISTGLVGAGVIVAAVAALLILRRPALRVGAVVLCALTLSYALRQHVLPEARTLHVSSEAVGALTRARLLPRGEHDFWVVGYRETSFVFMTRTDIKLAEPQEAGRQAEIGDTLMIEGRALPETEGALGGRGLIFARVPEEPVRGLNIGNGDDVSLFIGTVAERPPNPPPSSGELVGDLPPDPAPPTRRPRRERR